MIDPEMICMYCMSKLGERKGICSHCGFQNATAENATNQLECGSILAGSYLVGYVLGQGGFGITYIGLDINLNLKVAIKEYYPEGCVTRDGRTHTSVVPLPGEKKDFFEQGKKKFVSEAQALARFTDEPSIVGVRGFFYENGTAYIVMNFVQGETLKARAARFGGKLPASEVLDLVEPLCSSLSRVHEVGLLHRDISPDNIIIKKNGMPVLIDFGAARQISMTGEHSNTINVKHGFAPEEQYRTRGEQGPWTDVYALCATIYRLTTGVTPPQALDRVMDDSALVPPNQLGAGFTHMQECALIHGLAVRADNRIRDMVQLQHELYGKGEYVATNHREKYPLSHSPVSIDSMKSESSSLNAATKEQFSSETKKRKQKRVLITSLFVSVFVFAFLVYSALSGLFQSNEDPHVSVDKNATYQLEKPQETGNNKDYFTLVEQNKTYQFKKSLVSGSGDVIAGYKFSTDSVIDNCEGFTLTVGYTFTKNIEHSTNWKVWVKETGKPAFLACQITVTSGEYNEFSITFDRQVSFSEIILQPANGESASMYSFWELNEISNLVFDAEE